MLGAMAGRIDGFVPECTPGNTGIRSMTTAAPRKFALGMLWKPTLAGLAFYVLARVGAVLGGTGMTATPFWAASGFGLAVALRNCPLLLAGLWCGSFLAAWHGLHLLPSLMVAMCDTVAAILSAEIYRRCNRQLPWLGPLRDGLSFFLAATIVAGGISLIAGAGLSYYYNLSGTVASSLKSSWFYGDCLGTIIAGPVFISLSRWIQRPDWPTRQMMLVALATVLLLALAAGFMLVLPQRKEAAFLLFLVPMVANRYSGDTAVKFAVFLAAIVLLVLVRVHGYSLAHSDSDQNRLVLVMFIAALGVVWLVITAGTAPNFQGIARTIFGLSVLIASFYYGDFEKVAYTQKAQARQAEAMAAHRPDLRQAYPEPELQTQVMISSLVIILLGAFLGSHVSNLRSFGHKMERQVTERTKELTLANLALRAEQAETRRLSIIATEATNPIILTDGQLGVVWVNPSFTRFYGYTLEDIRGRKPEDFLLGPESNHATLDEQALMHEKREPVSVEILHYTKSGLKNWVSAAVRPVLAPEGGVENVVIIITDIHQRKLNEASLEEASVEARQASEAKSALIANVSHELRTPLNVIIGNLHLLHTGIFGAVPAALAKPLAHITRSSRHLLLLIDDLLDISKAKAGKLTLKLAPVNLRDICEDSLVLANGSDSGSAQKIVTRYNHRTAVVEADSLRLSQILVNVISNALKFTPASGTITLATEETSAPPELLIHIADTGPGIAPEDLERIFLDFERGPEVGNRGGSGLGLAIAQRLAGMHGGKITVRSTIGHGSTFTLHLPVRIPPPATPAPAPRSPAGTPHDRTREMAYQPLILAVDDTPTNLEILNFYLTFEGYRVAEAASGEEALARAAELLPDLILMDVKMSGIDGLEAIRRLRANPVTRAIPVISLTAFASPADESRCRDAGAADFVSKPINFDELGPKIGFCLASRRSTETTPKRSPA